MQNLVNNDYFIRASHVRDSFNAAASSYDDFSMLQRTVTIRLVECFDQMNIHPQQVLDIGSGTGYGAEKLREKFKQANIYQLDIAEEMLKEARKKAPLFLSKDYFLCASATQTPLPDNYFDLVFSNLMLQWCGNLDDIFTEIRRILSPNGVFVFSSFGPDTLKELRASWQQVDNYIHINAFMDMHNIGDSLIRNGMESPVLSMEHIVLEYDECTQLMRDIKNMGAHNVNDGRRTTLTGKTRLSKIIQNYETFRHQGKLPATYEVIYGHAWCPQSVEDTQSGNSQNISLQDLKEELSRFNS